MQVMNGSFPSIEQMTAAYPESSATASRRVASSEAKSFAQILDNRKSVQDDVAVKFSKHANVRLTERNIELSDSQISRLNAGTRAAGEKGINESLVMVDQLAFIVNVKNKTVITAIDQNDTNENVFTNIDGAVIA